jgi:hypothetical protein
LLKKLYEEGYASVPALVPKLEAAYKEELVTPRLSD